MSETRPQVLTLGLAQRMAVEDGRFSSGVSRPPAPLPLALPTHHFHPESSKSSGGEHEVLTY